MKMNSKQSGISLIEVLVVLVLLTVGILSVIRIFPPGFLINKQTEEATRGSRLAQQESNRVQASAANLPDSIVPVVYNSSSGQFVIDGQATPDDMTEAPLETGNQFPWSYYYSNVNKARRILGETVRIPLPSPVSAGRGSIYLLSFGPFMDVVWPNQSRSIFIQGAPLNRRLGFNSQDNPLPGDILYGPSNYAIDYNGKQIAFFPVNYKRQFLITFSYYNGAAGNRVETVVDQVIDVDVNAGWLNLTVPGNNEIVQFSDVVGRKFVDTGGAGWDQKDPYQFYIQSPTVGSLANVGVIVFNPFGHDYTEQTPSGPQPLTARVDYDVLDWHVIREDRPMPATSPFNVALSLKDLKKVGDIEDDQTTFNGLFYGIPQANNVGDFMIYNATTGDLVPALDPITSQRNYTVNFKDGLVTFNDTFGNNNPAGTFRFFYKAHGEWALVVQKANATYRRRLDNAVGYGEYFLGTGAANGGLATRMYLPLSEAGKTISIRELWYTDTGGNKVRVANESYRINAVRGNFETLTTQPLTWIDVKDKHPDAAAWDDVDTGQAVTGVQGISFRSRVLWRNGTTSSQDTSGNNAFRTRWRKVDVDTILTRSSQ
jgi:type II secretory pathway pseudopilin PulG